LHHSRGPIGTRLQEERQRVGLTQGEFAEKVGIAKRTLAGYEGGNTDVGASVLDAARTLGIDVLYVVTGRRMPTPADSLSEGEAEVLAHYRAMSEPDREAVKRMTSALAVASRSTRSQF